MLKVCAATLCAALIAAVAVPPAQAQTTQTKKRYSYTTGRATNADRPRARVTVAPRSFLDAGTEVKPGDRKFLDYALPPNYPSSSGAVSNTGGRVGWARDPFMEPFQLPGFGPW